MNEDFCFWCPFFDGGKCDRCPYIYNPNENDGQEEQLEQQED